MPSHRSTHSRNRHEPRQTHGHGSHKRSATHLRLIEPEEKVRSRGSRMRKTGWASMGAMGAGAAGIALANTIGVGELMFGAISAYIAYRVIRYGLSPTQALIEGVELEHGELPKKSSKAA